MKKLLIITFVYASGLVFGAGEHPDSVKSAVMFVVDSIAVSGNNTTDLDVILREMTFEKGDTVNGEILDYNKERIYSLSLFNIVKVARDTASGINIVDIRVEESWYIYPVPYLDLRENSLSKSTYGVFLTYKNFRGRNETIKSVVSFGYDPTFQLTYLNPRLFAKEYISLSLEFALGAISNKSAVAEKIYGEEFNYDFGKLFLGLGKRLDLFNWIYLYLGYEHYESPRYTESLINSSGDRIDRMPVVGGAYVYDSRDLAQFPSNGVYFNLTYYQKGMGYNNINHSILAFDLRQYKELIGDFSGKWRMASRFTMGEKVPYYDRSYLGYGDKVRGFYSRDFEGKHYTITSIEFKYPIIKDWKFSLDLPLIPKSLTTLRIGLYVTSFADAGTVYDRLDDLNLNRFYSGYGGGLSVLFLPHNVVRMEYGINEFSKGEFIFATKSSF